MEQIKTQPFCVLSALLWRLVRNKISIGVLIFCFVLATYTGGIQFLSHDMGRFDIFLNLFVILYYFIITSKVSESISVVIAVVFSIIGVLIHEIFVFVSFPMIIGLYVLQYHNRQSKALLSIALMATPVITVCILMALLTNLSQADVQAYYNYLLSKSGFVDTSPSSAINGFFSSVKSLSAGWLAISPERLFSREGFNRFSSGLVVVWPVIILLYFLEKNLE
jgi:hypothetical protein